MCGKEKVFAVLNYRYLEREGVFQGSAHQLPIHHRLAVVADPHDASIHHLSNLCQFLTRTSQADRSNRENTGYRSALRLFQNITSYSWIVIDGMGVGHAADRCETSGGCRLRPAFDGFLVFSP